MQIICRFINHSDNLRYPKVLSRKYGNVRIMESTIELAIFKKRLSETIAWCNEHIVPEDPVGSLRTKGLRPPGLKLCHRFNIDLHDVVQAIADERASSLQYWLKTHSLPAGLANGHLLICTSAQESIPDGAVTELSKGFYDDDDMPPWDTWLCYLYDDEILSNGKIYRCEYLVSWVPPEFIDLANIGVEKHFLDCMTWATDADTPFTRQLKAAGLLV